MFFSVIVPVHNGQKHIRTALDSALSMDTSFFEGSKKDLYEIIVVENGSSDDTPLICDEYAAEHEELSVIHKGKIGLYAARQVGIKEAKGDWIIALDGDDLVSENLLFELYRFISDMEKTDNKADIIYYDAADTKDRYKAMTEHPFEPGRVYGGDDKKLFYDLICRGDSLNSMWSKCIRKSIAYLGRENMYLNYGEDLYQTAEYADMAEGIAYINRILYYYRCDEGITSNYNTLFLDNQKIVWKQIDDFSSKWGDSDYLQLLDERKALTCSIAVAKLIYADMTYPAKKLKLKEPLEDEFYKTHFGYRLPSWAPEEDISVHELQTKEDPFKALMKEAAVYNIKKNIKKIIKKNK